MVHSGLGFARAGLATALAACVAADTCSMVQRLVEPQQLNGTEPGVTVRLQDYILNDTNAGKVMKAGKGLIHRRRRATWSISVSQIEEGSVAVFDTENCGVLKLDHSMTPGTIGCDGSDFAANISIARPLTGQDSMLVQIDARLVAHVKANLSCAPCDTDCKFDMGKNVGSKMANKYFPDKVEMPACTNDTFFNIPGLEMEDMTMKPKYVKTKVYLKRSDGTVILNASALIKPRR